MPVIPPPPPGPNPGNPGHFAWTDWGEDALVSLSRTPAVAAGTVTVTPSAANTPTSAPVLFPVGRFIVPPIVVTTAYTTVPGTATGVSAVSAVAVTAAGFTVTVTRGNTTGTTVSWVAMESGL